MWVNILWVLFVPAQPVLTDVDPQALLDTADAETAQAVERGLADGFDLGREVIAAGGQVRDRRDRVALAVRMSLTRGVSTAGARIAVRFDARLVVHWDAFLLPAVERGVPRPELIRRTRCEELARSRRPAGEPLSKILEARQRAARFAALACTAEAA